MAHRWLRWLVSCVAVTMSLFHLYTGAFGTLEAYQQRLVHVTFAFILLVLVAWESSPGRRPGGTWFHVYQVTLLVLLLLSLGYLAGNFDYLARQRFPYVTPLSSTQILLGLGFVVVVLEMARRTMGWGIMLLALAFFAYPMAGPYLPGILHHRGFSLSKFVDNLFFTTDGIFGIPIGISATYIVLFIIFGAFLEVTGFGDLLLHLSSSVAGGRRGGPAKIAVLASGLTGMISGSVVANVSTTGSFTIPLMKRTGYRSEFAGAVEAAASTGGQFLPPVMGAQAFIMAEFTGVPYIQIVWYSLLPAVLYYLGLWFNLDLEARRLGLHGLPRSELSNWRQHVLPRIHLLLPMVLLVLLLVRGYTPMFAVIYSILGLILISLPLPTTRFPLTRLWQALESAARMSLTVAAAAAVSGIIIGSVTLTGLGQRFSGSVLDMADGNIYLGLFFAMLAALVLGMGLPTIPAYIVQVSLVIPALVEMGLPNVVAHLFAIYFSCISMITPPVAVGAYAAAGLSGASATRTAFVATRLGAVGYIVPFMFAFNPALLLIGAPLRVLAAAVTASIGVFALAVALQGFLHTRLPAWQRLLALAAALLLIKPGLTTDAAGIVIMAAVYYLQRTAAQRIQPAGGSALG